MQLQELEASLDYLGMCPHHMSAQVVTSLDISPHELHATSHISRVSGCQQ
jgi:hypothetical protein